MTIPLRGPTAQNRQLIRDYVENEMARLSWFSLRHRDTSVALRFGTSRTLEIRLACRRPTISEKEHSQERRTALQRLGQALTIVKFYRLVIASNDNSNSGGPIPPMPSPLCLPGEGPGGPVKGLSAAALYGGPEAIPCGNCEYLDCFQVCKYRAQRILD